MKQPAYIRACNRLGVMLAGLGVELPALHADLLLRRAVRRTGLEDFGPHFSREGLERLTADLAETAALSQVGRIAARFNLLDHLCVNLRLTAYRAGRPEVAAQVLDRPLFIVGLPRTGTTILFELIAQDPQFRSPASWEVRKPLPPPAREDYDSDDRIRSTDRLLGLLEKLAPGFRAIHAIGARLPQECVYLLASSFLSEQFGYMYNVPRYRSWLLQQDMAGAYAWHARFLQHLQVDCSARHWVLKTPAHLACLQSLVAQYPDARIVWTHRRPLDAIASFSSLATTLRRGFSDAVDPLAVGDYEMSHYARVVEMGMAQRGALAPSQCFDVGFADICADPLAVVQAVYAHFGLSLGDAARAAMERYLQRRPRYLYGEHRYSWEQFGLLPDREAELYGPYLERYGQWLTGQAALSRFVG